MSRISLYFFTVFAAFLISSPLFALEVVERVEVRHEGSESFDPNSVLAFLKIREGTEFTAPKVADDVKSLKETGRFTFVSSEIVQGPQGLVVIFNVIPKPRLRAYRIEGASYFRNSKIKELLELEIGELMDEAVIEVRIGKLKEAYRKKYFPYVTVEYTLDNSLNDDLVDLHLTIKEGKRSKVRSVSIAGVPRDIEKVLNKRMLQKTVWIWSWISGRGAYDPDLVAADRLFIRERLRGMGYLDAQVSEPVISDVGSDGIAIRFDVNPGIEYRVNSLRISGVDKFPRAQIMERITLNAGDVASLDQIERSAQGIRDFYGQRGYLSTPVSYQPVPVGNDQIDLVFRVKERNVVFIRNIEIRGNLRTQDKVIRRELSVYPGDVYDEVAVRLSAARVRNLGFFSFANAHPRSTPNPDEVDLVLDVEEQSAGSLSATAGFSSVDDLIGIISLQQGNFNLKGVPGDMVGGGQKVKVSVTAGTKRNDLLFSFVEPWFMNRKVSLGFDIFRHERRFLSDDYDQRSTGAGLSLSKALNSFWRVRTGYTIENTEVFNVDDNVSELIKLEEGSAMESALSLSFTRDARNHPLIPTEGSRLRYTGKVAGGPLGFDVDYYQLDVQGTVYLHTPFKGHVLSLRSDLMTIEAFGDSDHVRIFDRGFTGGISSLRGFKYRDVGPRDELGEPVGGQSLLTANVEYTIPAVDRIRLAAFYDAGVVNEDAYDISTSGYNSDFGIGIRFDMPQFPIQLNYAWPLKADEYNDRSSGLFSIYFGYNL